MSLDEGQYQIGSTVFGTGTYLPVDTVDWGPADLTVNDVNYPGRDGVRMGRETRQGRLLTFEMGVLGSGTHEPGGREMHDRLEGLASEWDAEDDRKYAQVAKPLTYCRAGEQRRVYGRPRRFAPVFPEPDSSFVYVTADYQTLDHYSYSEQVFYTVVGTLAANTAGLRAPITAPITLVSTADAQFANPIRVGGSAPTPVRFWFFGPCVNPVVEVVGQFRVQLNVTLKSDEWAVVDPSPWSQMVRRSDLANLAGALSWESPPLSQMRVAPGTWRVTYTSNDRTGASQVYLDWRSAYRSY